MDIGKVRRDLMIAQADIGYRPKDDSIDIAIKALEDIKIISEALIGICEYECCAYGEEEALALAEKYTEDKENESN